MAALTREEKERRAAEAAFEADEANDDAAGDDGDTDDLPFDDDEQPDLDDEPEPTPEPAEIGPIITKNRNGTVSALYR